MAIDDDNVYQAFEILLEEIETHFSLLEKSNLRSWQDRDFTRAAELVKQAESIIAFREEVLSLQKKWETQFYIEDQQSTVDSDESDIDNESINRRSIGRLQRGMRTREQEFRMPILQVLKDKGGSAPMKEVLAELGMRMQGTLKTVDYDSLPSDPGMIRWRNTAQWSRQALVNDGLLKNDSPRGIWEISSEGWQYLKENS